MDQRAALTRAGGGRAGALRLYACQLLDDASAADDVVQEALVSLLTASAVPDDAVAWMYRVVRNAALDHRRSSARRRRRERRVAEARVEWFVPRPAALIDAETAERCLAGLEPGEREIIVLRIWSGLSFAQIAAVVQHSASTAHSRYGSALAEMGAALEDPCVTTTTTTATPDGK